MNQNGIQIAQLIRDFPYLLPEMSITVGAILIIILQLIIAENVAMVKKAFAIVILIVTAFSVGIYTIDGEFLNGLLWQTPLIRMLKVFFIGIIGIVLLFPDSKRLYEKGEYLFLIWMVLLGSMIIIQSTNLLIFYLGVELVSISSYLLIAFGFTRKGFEAGIKYLLFGALSSAIMLYGTSLLYGMAGSLDMLDIAMLSSGQAIATPWFVMAIVMFVVGLLFKLALAPMHIWTPDAYEAGPTPVVGLISVLPKAAMLIFFFNFIAFSGLGIIQWDWKLALTTVALISMFVGNLSALRQSNMKRMMAYSSIAHSGFLLVGLIAGSEFGLQTTVFYLFIYALMNLGVFYFIAVLEQNNIKTVKDLEGIGKGQVLLALNGVILLVSLTGLPPTGGFTAKLLIFSSLWDAYSSTGTNYMLWLLVLGIMNAAISLFYYFKIPYFMLIKSAGNKEISVTRTNVIILTLLSLSILFFFFKPDLLLNMLNQAKFAF